MPSSHCARSRHARICTSRHCNITSTRRKNYFDSKEKLLAAALTYTLENFYFDSYIRLYRELGDLNGVDGLAVTIGYLLDDITNEKTGKLFFDLWALAARDPEAERSIDELYTRHRRHIELLISRANPRLSGEKIRLRAAIITAQVEGLMLFMCGAKTQHPEFQGLRDEALRMMVSYATEK